MRPRTISYAVIAVGLSACDRATAPTDPTSQTGADPSLSGTRQVVDPAALTPAPPPALHPDCRADGRWIICGTTVVYELVNEPVFIPDRSRSARLACRVGA
jgi:hypothetical protein